MVYILGRFRLLISNLEMSKTIKKNFKGVKDAGSACMAEGRYKLLLVKESDSA